MSEAFLKNSIFSIRNEEDFNRVALLVFQYQYEHIPVYKNWCDFMKKSPTNCDHFTEIPFIPIEFFRDHSLIRENHPVEILFTSSGTTATTTSKHYVADLSLYSRSFSLGFHYFFGSPSDYHILALLPGYLEREGSSLIYMTQKLIEASQSSHSGFYLSNMSTLKEKINAIKDRKILLLGVSFALWEMAETYPVKNDSLLVMETGGMKGRKRELVREELHQILCKGFGVNTIFSEYGMTELLSQAYSKGIGVFYCPPWMKVLIRDIYDPLTLLTGNRSGGINVIDLANLYSCSFIATQDMGNVLADGGFVVTGRFDNSDTRGCNLMIS